jgi:predicted small secreted protein
MNQWIRKSLLLTLLLSSFALTACNTVEGAGKDVEELGEAVQDESAENNEYTE